MSDKYTLIAADLVHETPDARLLYFPDADIKAWIPKSTTGEVYLDREDGEIEIEDWLLRDKGVID